jgi:hypothetical protein
MYLERLLCWHRTGAPLPVMNRSRRLWSSNLMPSAPSTCLALGTVSDSLGRAWDNSLGFCLKLLPASATNHLIPYPAEGHMALSGALWRIWDSHWDLQGPECCCWILPPHTGKFLCAQALSSSRRDPCSSHNAFCLPRLRVQDLVKTNGEMDTYQTIHKQTPM